MMLTWIVLACFAIAPAVAQSLDGFWRSEGYGYVFAVKEAEWKAWEVTATTCLPKFTAKQTDGATADREASFQGVDGSFYGSPHGRFLVRPGGRKDHKIVHNEGSASDMRMDRVARLPVVCDQPTVDTPQNNFEVFARTWAEQYISFDLKHVDWEKVVEANRAKVTANKSPAELFDILAGMIQPFGDAHTGIYARAINKNFHGFKPGAERTPKSVLEVTDRLYLKGPMQSFCQGEVRYGHIDEGTGYLRILSFSGYSADHDYATGLTDLENALDTIFSDKSLKALIIDVRINGGGSDPYGLAIASRLTAREYLAYTKVARADPVNRNKWTPGDPSWVKPSTRPGFRGPIVELMGPSTVSAGETFTQALMGRKPHITRIGENTQGVFSDVLTRRLPNGWSFGLPNEVFLTPDKKAFDGPGIPPDIPIPVFAAGDVAAGRDPGMAKAIEVLRSR